MANIWQATVGRDYQAALDLLERAIRDCPDELWETPVWEVKKEHPSVWPVRRVSQAKPPSDAEQEKLLPIHGHFWNVAYHALFHVDFYLSGGKRPFQPIDPFREDEHHAHVVPDRVYTRAELSGYVAHCRTKARETFATLSDTAAAEILPRTGQAFAELLIFNVLHAWEHAAQLNLVLANHGVEPAGGLAAQQMRQALRHGVRDRT